MTQFVQLTRFGTPDAAWSIRRKEILPVPPERVWRALTSPSELTGWWCDDATVQLDVGGQFAFKGAPTPANAASKGKIVALEPARQLTYTWNFGDVKTTVEIDLEEALGQTELRVVQHAEEPLPWGEDEPNWWWLALPNLRHWIETGTTALSVRTDDFSGAAPLRFQIACTTFPWIVWSKLTDPVELARWWGKTVHVDLKPGGHFDLGITTTTRAEGDRDEGDAFGPTRIVEVNDDGRFSHNWRDRGTESQIEWTVTSDDDATQVTLCDHHPQDDDDSTARRVFYWTSTLLALKQMSERGITPREYQDA